MQDRKTLLHRVWKFRNLEVDILEFLLHFESDHVDLQSLLMTMFSVIVYALIQLGFCSYKVHVVFLYAAFEINGYYGFSLFNIFGPKGIFMLLNFLDLFSSEHEA